MTTELYVKDDLAWRNVQQLFVKDGLAWRTINKMYAHDGTAWRLIYEVNSLVLNMAYASEGLGVYPYDAFCVAQVKLNTNGTAVVDAAEFAATNWYDPTTTSIGSTYWFKYTVDSGDTPSGGLTPGTWYPLTSQRTLSLVIAG